MAKILVVEDEEIQRELIALHLETAGHAVDATGNAAEALDAMMRNPPDLIVADIGLPGVDGFGLLAAVRASKDTAQLPLVFLTAREAAEVLPKALALGVNEVLQKPLRRDSFLAAVRRCLKGEGDAGPISRKLEDTTNLLARALFEGTATQDQSAQVAATILFVDIRNFVTFAERLSSSDVAMLLDTFLGSATDEIEFHGGVVVKTLGDGLLALFQDAQDRTEHHAGRALKAALKIVVAARQFGPWITRTFPGRALPEFVVGIGVHSGDVVIRQMTSEAGTERTVIGDAVNVASRLEGLTKELGWSVVASELTIAAAGARFVIGERTSTLVKGREASVDVCEFIGIAPNEGATVQNWKIYKQFVNAIVDNTAALRRSQKTALRSE